MTRIIGTLCLLATALFAQAPDTLWTRTIEHDLHLQVVNIFELPNGDILLAGSKETVFQDTFWAGGYWLYRMNRDGEFVSERIFERSYSAWAHDVFRRGDGEILFAGTIRFQEQWLLSTNDTADSLASNYIALPDTCTISDVFPHDNDGFIMVGNRGTNWWQNETFDFFVLRTNVTGDTVWTRTFGTNFSERCHKVIPFGDGWLLCGTRVGYNPDYFVDRWVIRIDENGDSLWSRTYGGSDHYDLNAIATSDGGALLSAAPDGSDCISKIDPNGTELWTSEYILGSSHAPHILEVPLGYLVASESIWGGGYMHLRLRLLSQEGQTIWTQDYPFGAPHLQPVLMQCADGGFLVAVDTNIGEGTNDLLLFRFGPMGPSASDESPIMPDDFSVSAYPNPFNPSTTISFDLPASSQVKLTVFNTLGQQVAELADEFYSAGQHEIAFDGAQLPSGLYFYSLSALTHSYSGKLLLLK